MTYFRLSWAYLICIPFFITGCIGNGITHSEMRDIVRSELSAKERRSQAAQIQTMRQELRQARQCAAYATAGTSCNVITRGISDSQQSTEVFQKCMAMKGHPKPPDGC